MATARQKKLAANLVENLTREVPLNKKELVVSSGYSIKSAESSAHLLVDQSGVKDELAILGFDVETAKRVVGQIAINGENDNVKLKASEMIFKVHGTYAPEKSITLNINETSDAKLDALIAKIEDEIDDGT